MAWLKSTKEEDDAWRTASFRYLSGRLIFCGTIWPSQHQVDQAVTKLVLAREWCQSISDPRMKRECLSWCDYSQREIDGAVHELRTKEEHLKHEEWRRTQKKTDSRAADILRSMKSAT